MTDYDSLTREELIERLKKAEDDKLEYANNSVLQDEKWNTLEILLAKLSHEFKTPLNAIIGFTDLLKIYITSDRERGFLENISVSSKSMLDLIQNLFDILNSQYNVMNLEYTKFNTDDIILEVLRKYPNTKFDYTLANIEVEADKKRFRQLIYHLTSNAVKFNRPGGDIRIITYLDDCFNFEITDSGDGIREENSQVIFEFFSQVNEDTFKRQMGSGIGLALCKSILDAHNGEITVVSKEGEGSTFKFRLPLIKG